MEMGGGAAAAALDGLCRLAGGGDVVLLCYEPDGENCHRHVLARMLAGRMPRL